MSKKFATKKDMDKYIESIINEKELPECKTFAEFANVWTPITAKEIVDRLISDGYTDLENLIENGQAYELDGHTNNGWFWLDEIDPYVLDEMPESRIRYRGKPAMKKYE